MIARRPSCQITSHSAGVATETRTGKGNRKSINVQLTRDHGGSEERGGSRECLPQLSKKLLRLDKTKFTQALGYNVPGALLLALAVLEQLRPDTGDEGTQCLHALRGYRLRRYYLK